MSVNSLQVAVLGSAANQVSNLGRCFEPVYLPLCETRLRLHLCVADHLLQAAECMPRLCFSSVVKTVAP